MKSHEKKKQVSKWLAKFIYETGNNCNIKHPSGYRGLYKVSVSKPTACTQGKGRFTQYFPVLPST